MISTFPIHFCCKFFCKKMIEKAKADERLHEWSLYGDCILLGLKEKAVLSRKMGFI